VKYGFGREILGSDGEYLVRCAVRFGGSGLVKMLGANEVPNRRPDRDVPGVIYPSGDPTRLNGRRLLPLAACGCKGSSAWARPGQKRRVWICLSERERGNKSMCREGHFRHSSEFFEVCGKFSRFDPRRCNVCVCVFPLTVSGILYSSLGFNTMRERMFIIA
jgi:hypothetical protein